MQRILTTKGKNSEADTTGWENEIDRLVFHMYKLTGDEIVLVEASAGSSHSEPSIASPTVSALFVVDSQKVAEIPQLLLTPSFETVPNLPGDKPL